MLMIPCATTDHESDKLIIVLDPNSLERLKLHDPADVPLNDLPVQLVMPRIMIAYEENTPEFQKLCQALAARSDLGQALGELVKYLMRGWEYRPDKGDHDRGPESFGVTN